MARNTVYERVARRRVQRSKFDLSHTRKWSGKFGKLYPSFLMEVLPNEIMNLRAESFTRFAPLISPAYHMIDQKTWFFYVPKRLLWKEFETWYTGGDDGLQAPIKPTWTITEATRGEFAKGKLHDYLGVPVTDGHVTIPDPGIKIDKLQSRAYKLIWNEYFRDQDLQEPLDIEDETNNTSAENFDILNANWNKDYFSSARPSAQKGPEIGLPMDIAYNPQYSDTSFVIDPNTGTNPIDGNISNVGGEVNADGTGPARIENLEREQEIEGSFLIEELRRASAVQRFTELLQRGGSRFKEVLYNFWGSKSSDGRLDRPEYLGGMSAPVSISEIQQTSATYDESQPIQATPQGNLAGHGISVNNQGIFSRRFEEPGFVMGLTTTRPAPGYHQGLHKMWQRFERFDEVWPQFANVGEQEVLNGELYLDYGNPGINDNPFGYQHRYSEMKHACNSVHGDFRDTLEHWHLDRKFSETPTLSADFIEVKEQGQNLRRIFATTDDTDYLWIQQYFHVKSRRPLPYFPIPTLR
mgnify:CR=1 FL=1